MGEFNSAISKWRRLPLNLNHISMGNKRGVTAWLDDRQHLLCYGSAGESGRLIQAAQVRDHFMLKYIAIV